MRNRFYLLLSFLALLAAGGLIYWINARQNSQTRFDWQEGGLGKAYKETNEQPYGTQVLFQLLKTYFPGRQLHVLQKDVASELPEAVSPVGNYVFVGEGLFMDSLGTQRLLDFVSAGNTALLSSKAVPFDLMFRLYFRQCGEVEWVDYARLDTGRVVLHLTAPAISPASVPCFLAFKNEERPYSWNFIESDFFCDSLPQRPLGFLNTTRVNFAVFPYGKGKFLLHTTPLAFSNFHLLRQDGQAYAEGVLSYLQEGDIYWDAVSRVPESFVLWRNSQRSLPDESPLAYLLAQPPLAWSWYLLLGLAGCYLLFRAKRRQRTIPVLPRNENSTFEFINTIANLHFRERDFRSLSQQSMKLFLAQIRERYNLVIPLHPDTGQPRLDPDILSRLSQMSEVPQQEIHDIFQKFAANVQFEPDETMAVELYLAMEKFSQKAR